MHTENIGRTLDNDKAASPSGLPDCFIQPEYGIAFLKYGCVGGVEILLLFGVVTEVTGSIGYDFAIAVTNWDSDAPTEE